MKNILFLIFGVYNYSQCISGDCTNGEGKFRFTNPIASTYMGKFNDGLPNGKGVRTLRFEKGSQSETGNFVIGVLNDINGEIVYFDGDWYVGGVQNGMPQGKGKLITPRGDIKLDGTWFEGDWLEANKNNPYGIDIRYNGSSIIIDVEFGSVKIPMILDTGASIITLNKTQFYALAALNLIKVKNVQDGTFHFFGVLLY